MATDFLHGVEIVTVDGGPRPIQTVRSAIIGLIGTAPDADATKFPLDTPVLVNTRGGYAGIGATGTLAKALAGIFDQFSPFVVVVRVEEGASASETLANVVGGVDVNTGARLGVQAFRDAQTVCGVTPMLLIAPGFTSDRPSGVTAVAVTDGGVGYDTAPTVEFAGGGSDPDKVLPTAHAVLGTGANAGKVASIVIDTPGLNLTQAPTVSLTGGTAETPATLGAVTYEATTNPAANALRIVANQLRAHVIVAGPNTTDAAAIAYREDFGDRRVYVVDPNVKVFDTTLATPAYVSEDPAARVAGLIARVDHEVGFWKSPSNEEVFGIGGLDRPVDYALGDPNTRANLLNENEVATFIRDDGWRLWGNRTCSSDPKWAFLCVSRTADMIDLSIQQGHRWACDQVINKGYVDAVVASVNAYLRQLQARGAILGGKCWFDPDFNTDADISAGKVTFSYDFTPPYPAERVTFRSTLTDDYISSIFAAA
jgi:phage tail sheath protein FI